MIEWENFIGIGIAAFISLIVFGTRYLINKNRSKKYFEWANSHGYTFDPKIYSDDLPEFQEAFVFQKKTLFRKKFRNIIKGKHKGHRFIIGTGVIQESKNGKNRQKTKTVFCINTSGEDFPEMLITPNESKAMQGIKIFFDNLKFRMQRIDLKPIKIGDPGFDDYYDVRVKDENKAGIFLSPKIVSFLKQRTEETLIIETHQRTIIIYDKRKAWISPESFEPIMGQCAQIADKFLQKEDY